MTRTAGRIGDGQQLEPPGAEDTAAITVSRLRKTYGKAVAVDDVSFSVAEGEIFGILGPNGAGKTTALECVTGLRSPDSGIVRVLGLDRRPTAPHSTPLSASSSGRARCRTG